METSAISEDITFKQEVLIDPLDIFDEMSQWLICGNILVHLENFNYLVQCSICKHKFYKNEFLIKHLHEMHSHIFIKKLSIKNESDTENCLPVEDIKLYCGSTASENKLNVNELETNISDSKKCSSNKEDLNKLSNIEKESQPVCKDSYNAFNTRNIKRKSSSMSLKKQTLRSDILERIKVKLLKKKILRKEKCNILNGGLPDSLRIPINGVYACSNCSSRQKHFSALRDHFWLKHTYQFKLDDEKCVPNIPKNSPNPEDSLFYCTACLGRYANYESLLNHFKFHPGAKMIVNKPYKCSFCDSTFWTKILLKAHEITHTRERPFVCEICSKGFMRKADLVGHVRIHNDDRRYKCNFCDKRFFVISQKKIHELIHLGSKPHVCERCGAAYRIRSHLSIHMRRHTGEKPSVCKICNKAFFENKHLRAHMLIHSEKQFECKTCKKCFTRKTHLTVHEKLHSEDKNYICKICNQGFKQRAGLYSHMKCAHDKIKLKYT